MAETLIIIRPGKCVPHKGVPGDLLLLVPIQKKKIKLKIQLRYSSAKIRKLIAYIIIQSK